MKRLFIFLFVLLAALALSSCGMGWQRSVKDWQSNMAGGLDRTIIVENTRTGAEVFRFDGKAYIDKDASPGDVTIVCNVNGIIKKADFIGRDYGVRSVEK